MKTNVTLKVESGLLAEARAIAAREGRTISELLAEQLGVFVREQQSFERARERALARLEQGMDLGFTPAPSRAELHEL